MNNGKPPERLGITHWSSRFLAAELGTSFATVARAWRKWGIQPHRIETFKFKDLTAAIGRFIDACNQRCQPFAWTKDAGQILAKASRPSPRAPGGSSPGGAS